jgi:hypothetical protein
LGAQGTYCTKPRGGHLDPVHSDQKVLVVIRQWRLILLSKAKSLKTSPRDHQAQVHLDQMILVIAGGRLVLISRAQSQGLHSLQLRLKKIQNAQMRVSKHSRQPENLIKNRQSNSLNKSQLDEGGVVAYDDDDG